MIALRGEFRVMVGVVEGDFQIDQVHVLLQFVNLPQHFLAMVHHHLAPRLYGFGSFHDHIDVALNLFDRHTGVLQAADELDQFEIPLRERANAGRRPRDEWKKAFLIVKSQRMRRQIAHSSDFVNRVHRAPPHFFRHTLDFDKTLTISISLCHEDMNCNVKNEGEILMINATKIALVTGGSRGLGRDAALALSRKGIDVILTYVSQQEQAEAVVGEIERTGRKAAALFLNAGETSSFDSFVLKLTELLRTKWNAERIDYLVNNAGIGVNTPIANTTEEQFDSLMNVHFKGVFFLTQKLLPYMNDHGAIINLSTGLTRFSIAGYGAYAAMKGAIEVLTKYMAKELGPRGIRVNAVAPGAIATDFNRLNSNEEGRKHIGSMIALGRVGEPEDIGGVVASLCTDELGWINGQRIEVSGGMNL